MAKDETKELNPRVEAQRVEAAAKKAEAERLYERARTTPLLNAPPVPRKGYQTYVAGEECYTPDGKRRLPGEVFELKSKVKPSLTWCEFKDHISQRDE